MTKTLIVGLLAVLVGTLGCKEKKREGGLPPATEWRADQGKDQPSEGPNVETNQPRTNPHAGLGIPDPNATNPHAGLGIPNPNLGSGSGSGSGNPHAGVDMGGGGGNMRIPSRQGHPDRTLAGVLTLSAKMKAKVPPGAWLFIYAKPWDSKTNKMVDSTIVVKVDHSPKFPYKFTIDESSAMTGLPLSGTVVFEARLDGDKNASSRQKGDVIGRIKVTVPNTKLNIAMDTVLQDDVKVEGM